VSPSLGGLDPNQCLLDLARDRETLRRFIRAGTNDDRPQSLAARIVAGHRLCSSLEFVKII